MDNPKGSLLRRDLGVRTEHDEQLWEMAKERAAAQGRPKDWPYVMGIFQHMKFRTGSRPVELHQNPILLRSDEQALRYGTMVADAYLAAPDFDEGQVWRWELLIEHVEKLFERMQRGQQGVKVVYVKGQPYADERELQQGVEETGILYVSTDFNTHPVFTPDQNLNFRAVHDYMTHIARDVTFGLRGEIAAYNTHAKLAPPDAVPALFTEVLGQASVFSTKGFFPEQKIALLPFDYRNVGVEVAEQRKNPTLPLSPAAFSALEVYVLDPAHLDDIPGDEGAAETSRDILASVVPGGLEAPAADEPERCWAWHARMSYAAESAAESGDYPAAKTLNKLASKCVDPLR